MSDMTMGRRLVEIRTERPEEASAIRRLTAEAFAGAAHASGAEVAIVDALRARGDLVLSLVAVDEGEIVGHVAFSPVTIAGMEGRWYGLGPLSVAPARQRTGIGRSLIRAGLDRLAAMGAAGCALVGDPAVYRGSGFQSDGRLGYGDLDRTYIQRVVFTGPPPVGDVAFSPAFDVEG